MHRDKKSKTHKLIKSATGKGKSAYLQSLIESKVQKGEPVAVIDPKGKRKAASQKTRKKPRKQKR